MSRTNALKATPPSDRIGRDCDLDRELRPVPAQGADLDALIEHRPFAGFQIMGQAVPVCVPIGGRDDGLGQHLPDGLGARAPEDGLGLRVPVR